MGKRQNPVALDKLPIVNQCAILYLQKKLAEVEGTVERYKPLIRKDESGVIRAHWTYWRNVASGIRWLIYQAAGRKDREYGTSLSGSTDLRGTTEIQRCQHRGAETVGGNAGEGSSALPPN